MADIDNLSVTVNAILSVSDETAQRCMRLLEMWMDDNQDKIVCGDREMYSDGKYHNKLYVKRVGDYGKGKPE